MEYEKNSSIFLWCKERNVTWHNVKNTSLVMESRSGFSSNLHNPFAILKVRNEGYFASNLIYSGNHKEVVESVPVGKCRYLTGMNDYMMNYMLKPNESFEGVEAVFVFQLKIYKIM